MPVTSITGENCPDAADAATRRPDALALRIEGKSFRQIAEALGVSVSTAHGYVVDALSDLRSQAAHNAQELQALELARLDEMLTELWPKRAEPTVSNSILKVMERRAKMLGTDAPVDMRLGGIPGGAPIPTTGGFDLSKLSFEQLLQLNAIVDAGSTPAAAPVGP